VFFWGFELYPAANGYIFSSRYHDISGNAAMMSGKLAWVGFDET
jgi:hypothetical protein